MQFSRRHLFLNLPVNSALLRCPVAVWWWLFITLDLTTPSDAAHAYNKDRLPFPETSWRDTKEPDLKCAVTFILEQKGKAISWQGFFFLNVNSWVGKDKKIHFFELRLFLNMLDCCETNGFPVFNPKRKMCFLCADGGDEWESGNVDGFLCAGWDKAK